MCAARRRIEQHGSLWTAYLLFGVILCIAQEKTPTPEEVVGWGEKGKGSAMEMPGQNCWDSLWQCCDQNPPVLMEPAVSSCWCPWPKQHLASCPSWAEGGRKVLPLPHIFTSMLEDVWSRRVRRVEEWDALPRQTCNSARQHMLPPS